MTDKADEKGERNSDGVSRPRAKPVRFEEIRRRLAERRQLSRYGEDRAGLTDARQPEQPRSGPGGAAYSHNAVRSGLYGKGDLAYWTFEPADPVPESAPLVVFLHGGGGGSPARFGVWFDHLAKRGNLVVYPVYQGSMMPWAKPWDPTPLAKVLENVVTAVKDAIARLKSGSYVRPDAERVAVAGNSLGGLLAAQLAAVAMEHRLPAPRAIMSMVPGPGIWLQRALCRVDLSRIPPSALMLVVVCEEDKLAGDRGGRAIFAQTAQIPPENKNFVVMVSDDHGTPPLAANHHSPAAANPAYGLGEKDLSPPNAMHYYGYWKLFDALTDAAFYQRNREYALGNTQPQRFMGVWSDGVPVKELKVIEDPERLPPFRMRRSLRARG